MNYADTDAVTLTEDPNEDGGMKINVDTDTEFGERVAWIAGHRGMEPEELVRDAVEEFIEEERRK